MWIPAVLYSKFAPQHVKDAVSQGYHEWVGNVAKYGHGDRSDMLAALVDGVRKQSKIQGNGFSRFCKALWQPFG